MQPPAFVEPFIGPPRNEGLNQLGFMPLVEARREIEAWRVDYDQSRPRSSLGHLTPAEFAAKTAAGTMTTADRWSGT